MKRPSSLMETPPPMSAEPNAFSANAAGEELVTLPSMICRQGSGTLAAGSSMRTRVEVRAPSAAPPVGLLRLYLNCRGSCGWPVLRIGTLTRSGPGLPSGKARVTFRAE